MLTEISSGYEPPANSLVGDQLFPAVTVGKDSNKYYVYTRDTMGRVTDDLRAPAGDTNELPPMSIGRDGYFTEEHALMDKVSVEEQKNADTPLTPLTDATERL